MKVIPRKNYGSIPHLPESRKNNPSDKKVNSGQTRIATERCRDKEDLVIVQEKLDGSNVGVLRKNDFLWTLTRSGNWAKDSNFDMHKYFDVWVQNNYERFFQLLDDGERVVGEWMIQAHGTKYNLPHEPFVIFDIVNNDNKLLNYHDLLDKNNNLFMIPKLLHIGNAISIESVMEMLGKHGFHGAIDPPEGAVWRIERNEKLDFMCKFVREDKEDGCYLEENLLNTWIGSPDRNNIIIRK